MFAYLQYLSLKDAGSIAGSIGLRNIMIVTVLAYLQYKTKKVTESTAGLNGLLNIIHVTVLAYFNYSKYLTTMYMIASVLAYINYIWNQSLKDAAPIKRYHVLRNNLKNMKCVTQVRSDRSFSLIVLIREFIYRR